MPPHDPIHCTEDSTATASVSSDVIDARIRDLQRELGRDDHEDVIFALDTVGKACFENGDHDAAVQFYEEALVLKKNRLGHVHAEVADTLLLIGHALREKGACSNDSLGSLEGALEIYNRIHAERSTIIECHDREELIELRCKIVSCLNNIGSVHFHEGDYSTAMDKYQRALDTARGASCDAAVLKSEQRTKHNDQRTWKKTMAVHQCRMARMYACDTLNNIASIHAQKGNRTEAIKAYNEALFLQQEELGESDPEIAATLNNLGTMNFKAGNLSVAMKSYKQVYKMRRSFLGPHDSGLADALSNIAMVHTGMGEIVRAEATYASALAMAKNASGKKSLQVAEIAVRLGELVSRDRERAEKAIELYLEAWSIYKKHGVSDNHRSVRIVVEKVEDIRRRKRFDPSSFMNALGGMLACTDGSEVFAFKDSCVDTFLHNMNQTRMSLQAF